jgi:hypothetical protein
MRKRYWELPHCVGKPLVLAIEAFYEEESLMFRIQLPADTCTDLDNRERGPRLGGDLEVTAITVQDHVVGPKRIPSALSSQPDAEFLSGILFTNSGTHAKFSRMAYQTGYGNSRFTIRRLGFAYIPDSSARDALLFSYDLEQPPFVESWGQGLVVLRNPGCKHPVPDGTSQTLSNRV